MKKRRWKYLAGRASLLAAGATALAAAMLAALCYCTYRGAAPVWLTAVFALVCGLLLAAFIYGLLRPYRQTRRFLELFVAGYTLEGAYNVPYPYDEAMEQAMDKLREFVHTDLFLSAGKRQAQYLALQNQINPHFLYNTLEGIRGEAMAAGLDSVAQMTEALATFFRYTISNMEHFVTVEDELNNIENYFIIQQFRFGDRLSLQFLYDKEDWPQIKRCRMPKLTLQPIVENSIIHGIERKVGRGTLKIKLELTEKRLLVTLSDDGVGMEPALLQQLNERLNHQSMDYIKPDSEKRGGIAVVNVNNRLKLLFGEEYGIQIYSTRNVGTDVEITLPRIAREEP